MSEHDEWGPKPGETSRLPDPYREIDRLRAELEKSEKAHAIGAGKRAPEEGIGGRSTAGKRQAAPFSKGTPTPAPRPSGRRAGRHHGRHAHRVPPPAIDETIDVPLPSTCPACGGGLRETRVATQIQEEWPVVRPHVRRFAVHVGECRDCGRRVQGRDPRQTTDALGAASTHLGPQAVTLIVLLNKYLGLSHGKSRRCCAIGSA